MFLPEESEKVKGKVSGVPDVFRRSIYWNLLFDSPGTGYFVSTALF